MRLHEAIMTMKDPLNAVTCTMLYAKLQELWQAYAEACFDELVNLNHRGLGEHSCAELAVKYATWCQRQAYAAERKR